MGNNGYKEKIVISVGGSLIVPNGGIDYKFLQNLNKFIRKELAKNKKRQFFLITGGGATTRHYQEAARQVIEHQLTEDDLDWLGIHATRLNGHLLRTIFRDIAHPAMIDDYSFIRKAAEPVVVGAGWKPGWSTDYDAVLTCEDYGASTIINLSNINKVFNKDPNKFSDAKPIDKISWGEFRRLVGDKWTPGMHTPFDPIAAKIAQNLKIKVFILNGNDFENVCKAMDGKKFVGTVIG
jgi:uridylate kinase